MDRLHPILLFSRSIFDASAQTAGKGGGADAAVYEWEKPLDGSSVGDPCKSGNLRDIENLLSTGKLQNLL